MPYIRCLYPRCVPFISDVMPDRGSAHPFSSRFTCWSHISKPAAAQHQPRPLKIGKTNLPQGACTMNLLTCSLIRCVHARTHPAFTRSVCATLRWPVVSEGGATRHAAAAPSGGALSLSGAAPPPLLHSSGTKAVSGERTDVRRLPRTVRKACVDMNFAHAVIA